MNPPGGLTWIKLLEITAYAQLPFSFFQEVGLWPGYNVAIALWGAYTAFSADIRATRLYIGILLFSLLCDIIVLSSHGPNIRGAANTFGMIMQILNIFVKLAALATAALTMRDQMTASSAAPAQPTDVVNPWSGKPGQPGQPGQPAQGQYPHPQGQYPQGQYPHPQSQAAPHPVPPAPQQYAPGGPNPAAATHV